MNRMPEHVGMMSEIERREWVREFYLLPKTEDEYKEFTNSQLGIFCTTRGISKSGNKADLIAR